MSSAAAPSRLLAFLVQASAARRVAALLPEPEAGAALEQALQGRSGSHVILERAILERAVDLPPRTDLLYLGAPAAIAVLPPAVLVVAADPASLPRGPDIVAVELSVAPVAGVARIGLAMAGHAPTLAAMEALASIADAHARGAPTDPVSPDVGRLLFLLARVRRARRVLEIGTSAGASALWLASALAVTGGRLTTIERDSARCTAGYKNIRRAGLAASIDLRRGEAARLIPRLEGVYDLFFLDEAPEDRTEDLMALLPRCAPGALVVARGAPGQPAASARYHALVRSLPAVRASIDLALEAGLELTLLR